VSPAETFHDPHREVVIERGVVASIVMANGGYAAQQILEASPKEPNGLGYAEVAAYGITIRRVDIVRPGLGVGVRAVSKPRVQIEL